MTAKRQRAVLVLLALARGGGGGVARLVGVEGSRRLLLCSRRRAPRRRAARPRRQAGGNGRGGSVKRAADGVTVRFAVTDGQATTPVTFAGVVPDLFRERSGVIAEGRFRPDGGFVATELLAKHDEKYMPPPLVATRAGAMHETKTLAR